MSNHNNNNGDHRGAASAAPSGPRASSRPLLRVTRRYFERVYGSLAPVPSSVTEEVNDPECTIGKPTARAPTLDGALFRNWARRSRCGLSYDELQVLEDDAWEVWRVSKLWAGLKGGRSALVRLCEGAYQIPRTLQCDRAFVRESLTARFFALVSSNVDSSDVGAALNPIRAALQWWGHRLPDYSDSSDLHAICRASESFEWAMLIEGDIVVTAEDWEVTKGLSSRSVIDRMRVRELIDRGFHLESRKCFPPAPPMLRGVGCVPAGSALPPLWTLRFFAACLWGGSDGSRLAGAAERQRLSEVLRDELVVSLALGVTTEREAQKRTQVFPAEVVHRMLEYNGPDVIPTRHGDVGISAVAARLQKARNVSASYRVSDRPLHVSEPLYFVSDAFIDREDPAPVASRSSVAPVVVPLPQPVPVPVANSAPANAPAPSEDVRAAAQELSPVPRIQATPPEPASEDVVMGVYSAPHVAVNSAVAPRAGAPTDTVEVSRRDPE